MQKSKLQFKILNYNLNKYYITDITGFGFCILNSISGATHRA